MVFSSFALAIAILIPCIWGFMNVIDKFIISRKVKSVIGFTALAGLVLLFFGIVCGLFLDWRMVRLVDIWPVAVSGIIFGLQYFVYYKVMAKGDVSNFIGLLYFYPVLIALLSFIFLSEVLSVVGYIGMALSVLGALMLSVRIRRLHGKNVLYLIGLVILITAGYEFLIKVASSNIPQWNGVSLEFIFVGLTICTCLFSKKIRLNAFRERNNIWWAALAEFLTFLSIAATFFAMSRLPATVVSTISTLQPFVVLIFERALIGFFGKMHTDEITFTRVLSMCLIIFGVVLLILGGR